MSLTFRSWWLGVVLLGCHGEAGDGPKVGFSLDNGTLRDEIQEIILTGYHNQGVGCAGHALSGTPVRDPEVHLPIPVASFRASLQVSAGHWVFHAVAGNDSFPLRTLKPLAEGCAAARIAAGSPQEIRIHLHDLRPTYCQDGVLDPGEECDNGPDVPGDNCAVDCKFEAGVCGNGVVDASETCDDGGHEPGDGCDENCHSETLVVARRFLERDQTMPRIAAGVDASGQDGFVVAWVDNSDVMGSDRQPPGVVFGFFDERGSPTPNPADRSEEYLVNRRLLEGSQSQPTVAWSSSGTLVTFLHSWTSHMDVYMMAYDQNRRALWTEERHVPVSWSGVKDQSGVVGSHPEHDGYVVAWTVGDAPSRRGMLRVLDGRGEPLTGEIPFEATATGDDLLPAVAVTADGSFAVAWVQRTATEADIRLARFSAAGEPLGTSESVTSAPGLQSEPALAFDATGRLLVVWLDGPTAAIRGRFYLPDGTAGPEFPISVEAFSIGTTEAARVVTSLAARDGTFFVVWTVPIDSKVVGRLVAGTETFARNRLTGDEREFLIAGPPHLPSRAQVAITRGGVAMVVWQDRHDPGGVDPDVGIRGRLLPVP